MHAPALFLARGSPTLAIEDDAHAAFLTHLGASWRERTQKPRAVVVFYNLMSLRWTETAEAKDWAVVFDDWLIERTIRRDVAALFDYRRAAPHALRAVSAPEHLAPYWIALGAGSPDRTPEVLYRGYRYGSLSLFAVAF